MPWHGIASKGWIARNNVQRVGAFIIGSIYVVGAFVCIVATFSFRAELTAELGSQASAIVASFLLVCVVLAGAAVVVLLGFRLLRGALRSTAKHS
jgi:hypothetical protein